MRWGPGLLVGVGGWDEVCYCEEGGVSVDGEE